MISYLRSSSSSLLMDRLIFTSNPVCHWSNRLILSKDLIVSVNSSSLPSSRQAIRSWKHPWLITRRRAYYRQTVISSCNFSSGARFKNVGVMIGKASSICGNSRENPPTSSKTANGWLGYMMNASYIVVPILPSIPHTPVLNGTLLPFPPPPPPLQVNCSSKLLLLTLIVPRAQ